MRTKIALIFGLVLLSFAIAIYSYQFMPDQMASHWGISGEANGYSDKMFATFSIPVLIAVFTAIFLLLPKIDPMKENIKKFYSYYEKFVIVFIGFMLFLQIMMLLWNAGMKISFNLILPIAMGALFYFLGILLEKAKRNWTIGIRTPWTMSSEKVWNKTHKLAGKVFRAAGIISIIGVLIPVYSFLFVIFPVMLAATYLIIYSCLEYKKEPKGKRRTKR
ncbi:MAG: SdpI family protein [Candidatus Diapherotrites archaeon]|nr:SdpI family protein [Candidatus Diapherotrites archaeon]